MSPINNKSTSIFYKLLIRANQTEEKSLKLDSERGYMPLYLERIGILSIGEIWSMAHYGKQNGDAMRDPDVTFLVYPDGRLFPCSFRNDYLGIDYEAVIFEKGIPVKYRKRQYDDLRSFCHDWLNNIKHQQL
jgi:hypothetical protein